MEKVKITERGWPGHFICAHKCLFHRNTLIEYGRKKIVVSTVGLQQAFEKPNEMRFKSLSGIEGYSSCRWYETMAFEGEKNNKYWDADMGKQVYFKSKWQLCAESFDKLPKFSDFLANKMHNKVVEELSKKIKSM